MAHSVHLCFTCLVLLGPAWFGSAVHPGSTLSSICPDTVNNLVLLHTVFQKYSSTATLLRQLCEAQPVTMLLRCDHASAQEEPTARPLYSSSWLSDSSAASSLAASSSDTSSMVTPDASEDDALESDVAGSSSCIAPQSNYDWTVKHSVSRDSWLNSTFTSRREPTTDCR